MFGGQTWGNRCLNPQVLLTTFPHSIRLKNRMETRIVKQPILKSDLAALARAQFGDFVKAVVDVSREIMLVGGELHSDGEAVLLEQGSAQADLWGINLHPEKAGDEWIEFDSMINIRPSRGNRSRGVESQNLREKIKTIVKKWVGE